MSIGHGVGGINFFSQLYLRVEDISGTWTILTCEFLVFKNLSYHVVMLTSVLGIYDPSVIIN